MVPVPDPRLDRIAVIARPAKVTPTVVEFVDIAGLVAGASKGEGLGNQFLAHIRETDGIINLVRCFADENVVHVAGAVDPVADIETITTELALADLAAVERQLERVAPRARSGDKEAVRLEALLARVRSQIDQGKPVRALALDESERSLVRPLFLLTAKPAIFVANVDEHGFKDNPLLDRVRRHAEAERAPVVAICAKLEAEIAGMDEADRNAFLADLGLEEPGLNRLIRAAYAGRRHHPHRLRAWLHPRRGHLVRGLRGVRRRAGGEGSGEDAARGQGLRRPRRGRDPFQVRRVSAAGIYYFHNENDAGMKGRGKC